RPDLLNLQQRHLSRGQCGRCGQRRSAGIQTRSHEDTNAVPGPNLHRLHRRHEHLCERGRFQCMCAGPGPVVEYVHGNRCLRHFRIFSIPIPVLAAIHFPQQTEDLVDYLGAGADGDPVNRLPHLRSWLRGLAGRGWRDDRAAQLVEFAVSLPLLVVFVVGIFDFSSAFTLKQKLTNAARDAARVAAADPANDLAGSAGVPTSISDAYQVVDNYLLSENINDCGLAGTTPTQTGGTLQWVSPALSGCPGGTGLVLTIDRGFLTPQGSFRLVGTQVTLKYPYR